MYHIWYSFFFSAGQVFLWWSTTNFIKQTSGSGRLWTSLWVDSKPTTLQEQQLPFSGIRALPQVQSALVPEQGQELFHAVPHEEITHWLSDCIAPVDTQNSQKKSSVSYNYMIQPDTVSTKTYYSIRCDTRPFSSFYWYWLKIKLNSIVNVILDVIIQKCNFLISISMVRL